MKTFDEIMEEKRKRAQKQRGMKLPTVIKDDKSTAVGDEQMGRVTARTAMSSEYYSIYVHVVLLMATDGE